MINKKQLFIMIGAPGSGKSTWLYQNAQQPGDQVISRDAIRFSLLKDGEDYFAHEKEVYNQFIEAIVKELKNNNTKRVFADASHLNKNSRQKLLHAIFDEKVSYNDIIVNAIWLNTPLKICIERDKTRVGRANVGEDVIIQMWNSIRIPTADEGIEKVYIVNEAQKNIDIKFLNTSDDNNFEYAAAGQKS